MTDSKKWIALGAAGFMAFAAVAGGALFWVVGARDGESPQPRMVSGSLGDVVGDVGGDMNYEPTSAWIEDGLDLDVTQLDMKDTPATGGDPNAGVDVDAIVANTVAQRQNDLMPCYAQVLEEEDVQGTVDMQFAIAPDGHVAMVKVTHSSLRSKVAEDCFIKIARTWQFPRTGRNVMTKFDSDFGFYYE